MMKLNTPTLPDRAAPEGRQISPVGRFHGMMMSETALRIGAVTYLNSKPLVEGLDELLPWTSISLDFPSRLADDIASGELDVALIPSIEYFRGDNYQIISDACVAAHGPVLSVKLYSRLPWGEIRSLALDEGSRTSATLARILLAERHGVMPDLVPLPLDHRPEETSADAILLIGDRAILPPKERFLGTWDLGQEWFEWTGLPFVFAMWVANDVRRLNSLRQARRDGSTAPNASGFSNDTRRSEDIDKLDLVERALSQSRDYGVARLNEIARREAPLLGLTFQTTFNYLAENLQYHLGSAERAGLKLYYELASRLDLAPHGVDLRFRTESGPIKVKPSNPSRTQF